jgi:hypothetical protein
MKSIHAERGQTLVEAVVIIGLVVLLVTGLIAGTTMSLRTTGIARTRSEAVKYSQEGIELIRTIRDNNWGTFAGFTGWYCFGSDANNNPVAALIPKVGTCQPNITTSDNSFTRSVQFTPEANRTKITVSVQYAEGADTKSIDLATYFTQWK